MAAAGDGPVYRPGSAVYECRPSYVFRTDYSTGRRERKRTAQPASTSAGPPNSHSKPLLQRRSHSPSVAEFLPIRATSSSICPRLTDLQSNSASPTQQIRNRRGSCVQMALSQRAWLVIPTGRPHRPNPGGLAGQLHRRTARSDPHLRRHCRRSRPAPAAENARRSTRRSARTSRWQDRRNANWRGQDAGGRARRRLARPKQEGRPCDDRQRLSGSARRQMDGTCL